MFCIDNNIMLSLIVIILCLRAEILTQSKSINLKINFNSVDCSLNNKTISVQVKKQIYQAVFQSSHL